MQQVKALKVIISTALVGTGAAMFLTLATVPFATPPADATPAMAKGQACTACHTSAKPSKSDVKKKKSKLWPDEGTTVIAHLSFH